MPSRVNWGVIGCGWVARDFVIPAIQAATNAELIAVSDRNPEATKGLINLSLEELLISPVDAIYIATPNSSHGQLTICAAAAGKHILCEKPMSTNYADAERMVLACRAAGVVYATAFDQRFHDAHVQIRKLIAQDELGLITSARIHYACWLPPEWSADNWRTDPAQAGGGAFIDLAPHGLDLLQYILDDELIHLQCLKQTRAFTYPVDDGAVAIGRTAAGCLVTLQVAYNCPDAFPRRTLEIIGTEAMITAHNTMGQTPGGSLEMLQKDGSSKVITFNALRSPFLNQIEAFSQCLLDGTAFPFTPERDLQTMKLMTPCL